MNKVLIITLSLFFALTAVSCSQQQAKQDANSGNSTAPVNVGGAQTPTDAYIMLYTAVKAKQTDAIKKMMSQKTIGFAEGVAGQQKKPVEQVFENGFTATTFAPQMPQMRDERVKENMGALEVWNEKDKKWEDLPFIKEDDGWKLAIGDIFAGTYEKPAKGQAQIEAEASNTNKMIPYGNGNIDFNKMNPTVNSNVEVKKPMQVPKKPLEQK
jgi:hypothetical protein